MLWLLRGRWMQVDRLQSELAGARESLRQAEEATRSATAEGQRLREQTEELQAQGRALSEMQQQAQKYNAQLQEYNAKMQKELQVRLGGEASRLADRRQAGSLEEHIAWTPMVQEMEVGWDDMHVADVCLQQLDVDRILLSSSFFAVPQHKAASAWLGSSTCMLGKQ